MPTLDHDVRYVSRVLSLLTDATIQRFTAEEAAYFLKKEGHLLADGDETKIMSELWSKTIVRESFIKSLIWDFLDAEGMSVMDLE